MTAIMIDAGMAQSTLLTVSNAEDTPRGVGEWLCWSIVTQPDGASVQQAGTESVKAPAGVVVQRVGRFAQGMLLAWGLCEAALVDDGGGDPLAPGTALMVEPGSVVAIPLPETPTIADLQAMCGLVIAPQPDAPLTPPTGATWYRVLVRCR